MYYAIALALMLYPVSLIWSAFPESSRFSQETSGIYSNSPSACAEQFSVEDAK